ncbi:MAG TPA: ATP-binding protein [Chitinophagaceae bacterium]|nr:ATP-binding protein [Chitinophagaceae bacterium]
MKAFLRIGLLLLLPFFIQGQSFKSTADSLRMALASATTDSARFEIAFNLMTFYQESKRDSSVYYAEKSMSIARQNNLMLDVATALDGKGYSLMHMGKLTQSLQCFLEAVKIAEDPKNDNKTFYRKTKAEASKFRLTTLANIHHDWGHLMGSINLDEQIFHYRQTEKIASEIKDSTMLAFVNMNLGHVYTDKGLYDTALVMEQHAAKLFIRSGDKRYLGLVYTITGDIYLNKKERGKALEYYHKAIQTSQQENNLSNLNYNYNRLSDYYFNEQNNDSCLFYARKGMEGSLSMGNMNMERWYTLMYKGYRLRNDRDSVLKYQELALIAKDSSYKKEVDNLTELQRTSFAEQQRMQELEQEKLNSKNKLRNYALLGILAIFLIAGALLFRNNRQKQKAKTEIELAYAELKATQSQLIQSEKMASLGELTAGIAHEIQNPLNFVNNFSEVNTELIDEMKEEFIKGNTTEAVQLAEDIKQNNEKISFHGKRADSIVKGMLQHSRNSSGQKELTDINNLADECLRLSYHGFRAKDHSFNSKTETHFEEGLPHIQVAPQDIGRVLLNLITNSFYSVALKRKEADDGYEPMIEVSTKNLGNAIEISVRDNGNGVPQKVLDKIFQPFFTTKPTGEGTGLGLSMSYEIITKGHGGQLVVDTKEGAYAEFRITLPFKH